jgi:hypothetical protein
MGTDTVRQVCLTKKHCCDAKNCLHDMWPPARLCTAATRSLTALSAFLDVSSLNLAVLRHRHFFCRISGSPTASDRAGTNGHRSTCGNARCHELPSHSGAFRREGDQVSQENGAGRFRGSVRRNRRNDQALPCSNCPHHRSTAGRRVPEESEDRPSISPADRRFRHSGCLCGVVRGNPGHQILWSLHW